MKIKINRGTNQIGGCITEIESSKGTKIIIDIGANLPDAQGNKKPEIELEGLTKGNIDYKAVFITHYHGDHIGLYNKILPDIPIYIGEVSKEIYNIVQTRLSKGNFVKEEDLERISKFKTFKIKDKIIIDDMKITPIAVDHSAFDSYMFLIEADGEKVLHTGDFRTHGQRGRAVLEAIKKYVGKVDCLICEGTTLTRDNSKILTEFEIQKKAEEIFKDNKYNFVLCSSTNIDRIAALHKAALYSKRMFVCDNYQCDLLEYITTISKSNLYKFNDADNIKGTKVYRYAPNMLEKMKKYGFVMLVRANPNFEEILKMFENNTFIYSQWLGYLKGKNKDYKKIQEFTPKKYIYLHTTGHATPEAIKDVINITNPDYVIPIHTEDKEKIKKLTDKAIILDDNEEFILKKKGKSNMEEIVIKDSRAINENLLNQLQNGGFKEFTEFVREKENSEDKLALCFRGNSNPQSVVIYYNNHCVWELYINKKGQLSVKISYNHARYSEDWEKKYKILCNKYHFNEKEKINDNGEVDIRELTVSIPKNNKFSKEFVRGTFDIILPIIKDFFNKNLDHDYFKNKQVKHKLYLEKIRQQELYLRYNNLSNGIFVYDLEFAQRTVKNIQKNNNQPDMLGIEFKNQKPEKLLLIEVKSNKTALPGSSGITEHITKMEKYASDKIAINNRMIEANEILEQYKKLELRNIKQKYEFSKLPIEILVILTDGAAEQFIKNKNYCEKIKNGDKKSLYKNFISKGYTVDVNEKLKEIYIYKVVENK